MGVGGQEVEVAYREQLLPFCQDCWCCLQGRRPQLPSCSLGNDMWMGKLLESLDGLSRFAWKTIETKSEQRA